MAALALAGNLCLVGVIRSTPSLHTPTNALVVALAAADAAVGANIPFYITFYFDVPYKCSLGACLAR